MPVRDLLSAASGASSATYIEDVFSTYLYTGTGATQTITNGIDLAGKGGLTWIKGRSGATGHRLTDTVRGATKSLESNSTAAEVTESTGLTVFGSTGFTIGADTDYNTSSATYASWTFRKQPKFFDVVTYTGTSSNRTIAHNLGSVPGMMIVKCTSNNGYSWIVYHRSLNVGGNGSGSSYAYLNDTAAAGAAAAFWNATDPTSSVFTVGTSAAVNQSGYTYVAYLFAHNAGGFGTSGADNVISCGTYTTDGSGNATINLGYEPQYVLYKRSTASENWFVLDVMRGFSVGSNDARLFPSTSDAENTGVNYGYPTATGFNMVAPDSATYIYMAIRRPMKVPTDATKVFKPISTPPSSIVTAGFVPDFSITKQTDNGAGASSATYAGSRLQGNGVYLSMSDTSAEGSFGWSWDSVSNKFSQSSVGTPVYSELFARATGFFDQVCYTGTGSATTQAHNLGVIPELIIVKERSSTNAWWIYHLATGNTNYSVLNTTAIPVTSLTAWNNTTPTSSVFSIGTGTPVNASTQTYVAYLFATCPGVSKVGSYTGTGATQTINCGFTGGARFVLIKRTDATGDWYVWDTARGMVSGTDPSLLLNSTAVEVNANSVYTATTGFQIVSTAAGINASGGSYIFLAIA
jgi:hypothetical protein